MSSMLPARSATLFTSFNSSSMSTSEKERTSVSFPNDPPYKKNEKDIYYPLTTLLSFKYDHFFRNNTEKFQPTTNQYKDKKVLFAANETT